MNEIIKMIIEDDHLFKVKNDGTMDPLTLEKLTKQRRDELKSKLDKHSLETAERMKEEVMQEFSNYRMQMKEEINNKINATAYNFNEKLDSNLHRFDRDVKAALADIHKPMDLLDISVLHEERHHNLQNIFDLKDYMKADMESSGSKLNEKLCPKETPISCYDLKNFEYSDSVTTSTSCTEQKPEPQSFKGKMALGLKNSFTAINNKLVCFKKIKGLAFHCFPKKQ